MNTKFVAAIAVLTAATATFAFAQGQTAPKASKAEVQKVLDGVKNDKGKLAQFCDITKLEVQATALSQKNQNDPKLQDLGKQMDAIAAKLGSDYQRIINSELDDASAALFDDLSKSCNVGFQPLQAAPKVSKADVQKLANTLKTDKTKLAQFCELTKLASQAGALAQKNQRDPKLQDLEKKMDEIAPKLGPDYTKIISSDLDEASAAPLDDLAKSCK